MSLAFVIALASASAGAAALGIALARRLCAHIVAFDDGPPTSEPPVRLLVVTAALLGALLALRTHDPFSLSLALIGLGSFAAAWSSDALRGVIPDLFTLVPLAVVVAAALARHDPSVVIAVLVPALPFALSALSSRGLGMGWGDVKLVALGGALLGAPLALLAFAGACVTAFVLHRHRGAQPLAFGPYLAGAAAFALPLAAIVH